MDDLVTDNIISEQLKVVQIGKAKNITLTAAKDAMEFHETSGNEHILKQIKEELKQCEPSIIFFEHSYFATTLENENNAVFVCVWDDGRITESSLNAFQNCFVNLNKEFEPDHPLLWHPGFAFFPDKPQYYISCMNSFEVTGFNPSKYYNNNVNELDKFLFKAESNTNSNTYVGLFNTHLDFEKRRNDIKNEIKKGATINQSEIHLNNEKLRLVYNSLFEKKENEFSYKLSIPILGSPFTDDPYFAGQGAIFVYFITKKPIECGKCGALAKKLDKIFKDASINYIFYSGINLAKKATIQATRAAIAQVMARNMSHNIGSHVLNKVYKLFLESQDEEDLKRAAHLYEFIQKRMEFIANGVSASFQSTHHLFEEILPAYLNNSSEEKIRRGQLKSLFDNISGNERVTCDNIIFNKSGDDILVSIPNGTLGFHALFTLLENIIRNSVKHNQQYPENDNLVYTIRIESDAGYADFYKVSVTDNFGEINKKKELDVAALNNNMNQLILDKGGLRPNHWGLMEMKICATYLLGLPIDLIDSANNSGNRIPIHGIEQSFPKALVISEDAKGNLVHTFYLQKPKVAAINGSNFKQSESQGIELVTNQEVFEKFGSKHLFAVFDRTNVNTGHEHKTNQRSVFFETTGSGKLSINENMLWEEFSKQRKWKDYDNDVKIISKDNNLKVDEGFRYIILDQHDEWARQNGNWEKVLSNPNKFLYYEYVSAQSATNAGVCNVIQHNNNSIDSVLRAKIFEMAFTDIIVLDERIQKNFGAAKLNTDNKLNPKFANLFIPPFEGTTNLDKARTEDIISWEEKISEFKEGYKLNYLVIHRSIIGKERIDIDVLKSKLNPDFTIFVSGGGTPPNLKEDEFYIPFDVLNYCLGSNPSKFALVGVLKSLRQINKL